MRAPLDNLHDFYQPPPPSWRPQTLGWYAVFAIAALLLLWLMTHLVRRWIANRYRREALDELGHVDPTHLSALLKRTALSVWPREEVAALSGEAWLRFLNNSVKNPVFDRAPANRIEELSLKPSSISTEDENVLRNASTAWIKKHKAPKRQRGRNVQA